MPDQHFPNRGDLEFMKEQIVVAVESSAEWRRQKAHEYPEDMRNARSSDALGTVAERLAAFPSEHQAFRDLALLWFDSELSTTEAQSWYIGRYGFDEEEDAEPEAFLEGLREALMSIRELPSDSGQVQSVSSDSAPARGSGDLGSTAVRITPTNYAANNANIVIQVNTGSAEFVAAVERLEAVLVLLRGSNEIAPETKKELEGEIKAGLAIAASGRANREYLDLLLFRPLRWMIKTFISSAIGTAASLAVKAWVRALFGGD